MIMLQRNENHAIRKEKRDLEEYLDNLLVRVMEVQPLILQHPSQRPPPASGNPQILSQSEKHSLMLDVARLTATPYYPPPAYTHPPAKTLAKPGKTTSSSALTNTGANQKRERKSSNPFKRLSSAFK